MTTVKKHINIFSSHGRLEQARLDAGFSTSLAASRHFNWKVGLLRKHESGDLQISKEWAEIYAAAFKIDVDLLLTEKVRIDAEKTLKLLRLDQNKSEKKTRKKREHLVQLRIDLEEEGDLVELKIHKWMPFDDAIAIVDMLKPERSAL